MLQPTEHLPYHLSFSFLSLYTVTAHSVIYSGNDHKSASISLKRSFSLLVPRCKLCLLPLIVIGEFLFLSQNIGMLCFIEQVCDDTMVFSETSGRLY